MLPAPTRAANGYSHAEPQQIIAETVGNHMENKLKKDIQSIIDYSHEFAEHMLNNGKEYYPFGAQIENSGELFAVAHHSETNFPKSHEVINELKTEFEEQFANGKIKAYGITYDVRVQINDFGDKSDAICIDITHRDSVEIPRYYFTYVWDENDELTFGQSFGIRK